MAFQPYAGTKLPEWVDPAKSLFPGNKGIYKGIVQKIDTATRSGRLYVYVEGFSTATANDPKGWILVEYASPFSGRTLGSQIWPGALNKTNDFTYTKQSYGFFMTPPDIGGVVLCCFPENNSTSGYWFACVTPDLGKGMIPAIGGVKLDKIDPISVPPNLQNYLVPGGIYPAGEFNENDNKVFTSNWAKEALRPLHVPKFVKLVQQGLQNDLNGRGTITSSVQRDPISSVFGFSTPGRPTNDPANDPTLSNRLATGDFNPEEFIAMNRVGGHSLTMDDGDVYGKSNLVKLRTAAGHQIFMNDTDGFMYIANSNGTAWVELTKEGDILVFGARDFSLRTYGNIMMHTNKIVSINAGLFNVKAQAMQVETQSTILNSEASIRAYGGSVSVEGLMGVNIVGGNSVGITGGAKVNIVGGLVALNSGPPTGLKSLAQGPTKLTQYSLAETLPDNVLGWTVQTNKLFSINNKVPTHEPYIRGDIATLQEQQEQIQQDLVQQTSTTVTGDPKDAAASTVNLTPGIDAANGLPVDSKKTAPASAFITQPDLGKDLGKLNRDQLRAYMAQVGHSESSGRYTIENRDGYQGKYQMGSLALQDMGYVKPGTPQTAEALNNPNNWTGKNGVTSAAVFRSSPEIQEETMYRYTKQNYSSLQRLGLISDTTDTTDVAGLLSASHLGGPGNVSKWARNGTYFQDKNGTDLGTYYNLGKYSQTQVSIITASNESKSFISSSGSTTATRSISAI